MHVERDAQASSTDDYVDSRADALANARLRAASPDGADLAEFIWILRRNAGLIGAFALAALLIGGGYAVFAPRKYTATTSILFDSLPHAPVGTDPSTLPPGIPDPLLVESQLKVISADAVLRRVVVAEGLDKDPDFVAQGDGLMARLKYLITGSVARPDPVDQAVAALARDIEATRSEKTYVIDLAVSARDPGKAARLADAVTSAYLADQRAATGHKVANDTQWLDQRIADLQRQRDLAEQKVARFQAANEINDANGKNVAEQELGDLATQLVQARAATTAARARAAQIHKIVASGRQPDATAEAMGSAALDRLHDQYAALARQVADDRLTYGDLHPALLATQAQERGVQVQINQELQRIAESADNNLQVAEASERDTAARLDAARKAGAAKSQALLELADLQRNADEARTLYEQFVQAREKILGTMAEAPSARVIAPATAPLSPSSPKTPLVLTIALFAGLFFGSASALAKEALRGGGSLPPAQAPVPPVMNAASEPLRPSGSQRRSIKLPRIHAERDGFLQRLKAWTAGRRAEQAAERAPDSYLNEIARRPGSPFARAIQAAWMAVAPDRAQNLFGRPWTIAVTSMQGGNGKTTAAANLARAAEKSGVRVLLIEANGGSPRLSDMIEAGAEPGVIDLWDAQRVLYQTAKTGRGSLSFVPILPSEPHIVRRVASAPGGQTSSIEDFDVLVIDAEADHSEQIYRIVASADRIALVAPPGGRADIDQFISIFGILFRNKGPEQLVILEDGRDED